MPTTPATVLDEIIAAAARTVSEAEAARWLVARDRQRYGTAGFSFAQALRLIRAARRRTPPPPSPAP